MKSQAALGFTYRLRITHVDGRVEESEDHNLVPIEGQNHMMGVTFKSVAQVATWYLSVYEGNYTPTLNDTAATYAANATECTAYTPTSRPEFIEGAVAVGAVDNSASIAVFTMTANKTLYGAAMLSSSVKGSTNGILMSIAPFSSPKILEKDAKLELIAGNSLTSV
jgi:hypothetical protein